MRGTVSVHTEQSRPPANQRYQPEVDVRILGPLRIAVGGRTARLRGDRVTRLAALLSVSADAVVPFDRIVDVLWDDPPESARQQVHNVVGTLRRALAGGPGPLVVTEGSGYRLAVPQSAVDAYRFQAAAHGARQALAEGRPRHALDIFTKGLTLWRGPALAGLRDSRLANTAAVLDEQRLDAIEAATDIRLRLGEAGAILGELSALVAEHPFRESLRALLMRALHAAGRQADALAVYEAGRRMLADELGLDPGPQLRRAHDAVLRGETAGALAVAGAASAMEPTAEIAGAPGTTAAPGLVSGGSVSAFELNGSAAAEPDGPDADLAGAGLSATPHVEAGSRAAAMPDVLEAEQPIATRTRGPVAQTVPAPRIDRSFLPRDIGEFVGRRQQTEALIEQAGIGGPAPQVAVIDGMGGVGKSALAVHVAHRLVPQFPDGHYFIDLSGFCAVTEPLEPAQALEALLRASGLDPESLPEGMDERSALWRARLAGRRVLVLLDNARDAAQVRPLLPGTGEAFVLITSRRRMPSLEGAVAVPLDVMRADSAIALFSRIIGPERAAVEPEAVASAVELCGHLPLAIQVAAARLRDRATWPVERVAEQLSRHRTRFLVAGDRDVTAILAWSYHLLPAPGKRLFRLLSVHPGPDFDAHTASALTGMPLPETEAVLEQLFEANLLQERVPGRYHLHDLVHDCAAELQNSHGEAVEQALAEERLIDYHVRAALAWCAVLASDRAAQASQNSYPGIDADPVQRAKDPAHALRLLEANLGNFVAVRRLAVASGRSQAADELAKALAPHFGQL
ncbi:MAG: AfsR family transcriptional regulator [Catenulispora sp.]|nr:AfsR family transcriptional regulator [Catenulispora sp.]